MRFFSTLTSQFVALVAAAVVLSNVAVTVVLERAREGELQTTRVNAAVERIASVFRYVASIPQAQHAIALRALSGNVFHYAMSPSEPFADSSMHEEEERIAAELEAAEGGKAFGSAHVRLTKPNKQMLGSDGTAFEIAQALTPGGEWLMARFDRPRVPSPAPLIMLAAAVGTILTGGAAAWLARRVSRPLLALARAADVVARGRTPARLSSEGPRDIKHAAEAFNAMSTRVTHTLERQRRLLSAVGHDLRTPLAAIRISAEFVADEAVRDRLTRNLDELQSLTEAVLSAARSGIGEDLRRVDLAALVESVSDDLTELGLPVDVDIQGTAPCNCRPNEVRRAVRNLIENAVRYGVSAHVSLRNEGGVFVVTVEDDGPGIPEDRLENVFEPFVRLEESRNSATGGTGLGLTLARSIAREHGGEILLENRRGASGNLGLRASLRLPGDSPRVVPMLAKELSANRAGTSIQSLHG